jgi:hypothetical protein
MGYLGNHLATVVVSAFAAFLTGMYFIMPEELGQLLLVSLVVTWFLAFICWMAQKSADYAHKHGSHSTHHEDEKKSLVKATTHSSAVTTVSIDELKKFKESFTAELNGIKDEVKLKDEEIAKLRQQIANLETLVQIEALKAELANLKVLASKEAKRK